MDPAQKLLLLLLLYRFLVLRRRRAILEHVVVSIISLFSQWQPRAARVLPEPNVVALQVRFRMRRLFFTQVRLMNEREFMDHFRVSRKTFVALYLHCFGGAEADGYDLFADRGPRRIGRSKFSNFIALLVFLWVMATGSTFRSTASRFCISTGKAHVLFQRILDKLFSRRREFIRWPDTAEMREIARSFSYKGLPNIIGAVDGTHIEIEAPVHDRVSYINRKQRYTMNTQCVVDHRGIFRDVCTGFPGSVHDSRMFSHSKLFTHQTTMIPDPYYIIGDSGYPLRRYLITPYKMSRQFCATQRLFNRIHAGTRMVVERAFGRLKGRWKVLNKIRVQPEEATKIIIVACILHNCAESSDDHFEGNVALIDMEEDENDRDVPIDVIQYRDELAQMLSERYEFN